MIVLISNFFIYLIWWYITFRKEGRITILNLMIGFYVIVSFLGVIIVNNGLYKELMSSFHEDDFILFPYILCFISYFFLFLPLTQFNDIKIDQYNIFGKKRINICIYIWCILYLFFTVLKVNEAVITSSMNLADVYHNRHSESIVLFEYTGLLKFVYNLLTALQNITVPLIMFYCFIGLKLRKIKTSKVFFLVALCFLPSLLSSFANSSRGSLYMDILCFCFFLILFWKYISNTIRRKLIILLSVILSFGIITSLLISFFRAQNDGINAFDGIMRYFGEPFPNLCVLYWEKCAYFPMGERMFGISPDLEISGLTTTDKVLYWLYKMKVPTYNFRTYFGDFYIEFGWFIGLIIILSTSYLVYLFFKKKKLTILTLPFAYFYYQLCVYSFAGFTKNNEASFHQIILLVLLYIFLPIFFKKYRINK